MPATVNPRPPLLLNKVPEVTAIFWIIKILSTTVGETGADYLAVHVGLGASTTIVIMAGFLVAALALQLRAKLRSRELLADGGSPQRRRHADHRLAHRQV